ncbi:hypothetical protein ACFV2U_10840 [Streptomyces sp. NPDC059697]|uniref:hypothetical protein n=1 Tax=Streptomyces sp. NPDC059697 TaxID=3346912 RepID=UPI0036AC15F2
MPAIVPWATDMPRIVEYDGICIGLATGAAIVGGAWAATGTDGSDDKPGAGGKTRTAVDALRASPDTFTLTGDFKLTDGATDDGRGGCEGTGGYDDIAEGTSVTVYDATGAVIATGSLGTSSSDAPTCTFDVSIDGVPGGEDFCKVEVSHRGTVQLNADQAKNGLFAAGLGQPETQGPSFAYPQLVRDHHGREVVVVE